MDPAVPLIEVLYLTLHIFSLEVTVMILTLITRTGGVITYSKL